MGVDPAGLVIVIGTVTVSRPGATMLLGRTRAFGRPETVSEMRVGCGLPLL